MCEFIKNIIQKFVLFVYVRVLRVSSSTFWFLRPLCATWWHSRAFLKCSLEIQKYRILMNLNIGDFRSKNTGIQSLNFGHPLNWSWAHNFDLMSFFLFFKNIFVFQLRIIGSCQKLVFRSNKNLYENLLLVLGNFNTRDFIKISAISSKNGSFEKNNIFEFKIWISKSDGKFFIKKSSYRWVNL